MEPPFASAELKILPAYTGATTVEQVLDNPRASALLWLEILVNVTLDLSPWNDRPEVQAAVTKARG